MGRIADIFRYSSGYKQCIKISPFLKKFTKYLLRSTQYNGRPDNLLVWATIWVIRVLLVSKQTLIILIFNLLILCEYNMCSADN